MREGGIAGEDRHDHGLKRLGGQRQGMANGVQQLGLGGENALDGGGRQAFGEGGIAWNVLFVRP